jgi:chondroitin AC lyase
MTGNVSDGKSGLTSMQVTLKDGAGKQHLSAQKIWATHKDIVVCLTGNVEGHISGNAFTTLDQCRWRGDVTVNAPGNILKEGIYKSASVKWIHHAGFAYITFPFYETKMEIELKTATGNWSDLSKSNPQRNVTEKIFHAKIDHGHTVNAENTGYTGYIVVPAATALEAQQLAAKPTWGILRGNNNCLSVIFDDETIMTAFFNAMALKNDRVDLEVNRPCLVLIADGKLYVSNFTSAPGERIRIRWNKTSFEVVTSSNSEPILAQQVEED